MKKLTNCIALVGGASRGAGRGIAVVLGEAGATVYCAARTRRGGPKPIDNAPGTVEDTADEVTSRGGNGIPVSIDLSNGEDVAALFRRIETDHGKLHLVANSAWSADCMSEWCRHYWETSPPLWQETIRTMSTYWHLTTQATRIFVQQKRGLIIHVTDNHWDDSFASRGQILHDLGHDFVNRLILNSARESAKRKVTVVGLNPGFMRTERVRMHMTSDKVKRRFRYDLSESPEYIGRAVAALAADPRVHQRNGHLLRVADLAKEYGFTDIDGRDIAVFDPSLPLQAFPAD